MKMKKFQIWSEGFRATGESQGAFFHGVSEGENFKDAVLKFVKNNPDFAEYFDSDTRDDIEYFYYWGCRLFDNEQDARKSFG